MFERILVVCTGNICRSPVAAAMLQQALPGKHIESAGLNAMVGQGVEPSARELAEAAGLDVSGHEARQLSREMLANADVVLVMSEGQRLAVGELSPAALGKTLLLGRWLEGGAQDIADPYRKSQAAFAHIHELLERATAGWARRL